MCFVVVVVDTHVSPFQIYAVSDSSLALTAAGCSLEEVVTLDVVGLDVHLGSPRLTQVLPIKQVARKGDTLSISAKS